MPVCNLNVLTVPRLFFNITGGDAPRKEIYNVRVNDIATFWCDNEYVIKAPKGVVFTCGSALWPFNHYFPQYTPACELPYVFWTTGTVAAFGVVLFLFALISFMIYNLVHHWLNLHDRVGTKAARTMFNENKDPGEKDPSSNSFLHEELIELP